MLLNDDMREGRKEEIERKRGRERGRERERERVPVGELCGAMLHDRTC